MQKTGHKIVIRDPQIHEEYTWYTLSLPHHGSKSPADLLPKTFCNIFTQVKYISVKFCVIVDTYTVA